MARRDGVSGARSVAFADLDPETHFGLRPGLFGEWYFNFGWIGVVIQATLTGLLAGLIGARV